MRDPKTSLSEALEKEDPILIYANNQSALSTVRNSGQHPATKHIDIRYHHQRDEVRKGTVKFQYLRTDQMLADGMTKSYKSIATYREHTRRMGLSAVKPIIYEKGYVE